MHLSLKQSTENLIEKCNKELYNAHRGTKIDKAHRELQTINFDCHRALEET